MVSNWVRQTGYGTKDVGASQLTMMTTNNSYKMHDPGLAESCPSILRGDRILICISGGGVVSKFKGVVYCACQEYVIMILPKLFDRPHVGSLLLVDVRFTFS
jgi:hypothetical protein